MSNDTAAPLGGPHSAAWIAQAQISFGIACSAMIIGVAYLPVDRWIRAFLGLGLLFVVSSSLTLAKMECPEDSGQWIL